MVSKNSEPTNSLYGKIESEALSHFSFLNLKQFNYIKNRNNSILDLILSNSSYITVSCEISTLVQIDYLYHPALLIKYPICEIIKPLDFNYTVYDYVNCDYNVIRASLANINWDLLFYGLNINEAITIFYYNVFNIIDSY